VPMVSVFDSTGNLIAEELPRVLFPHHEKSTNAGYDIGGQSSIGIAANDFWFWLPGANQLTEVGLAQPSGSAKLINTGLPNVTGDRKQAEAAGVLPSGELVLEFTWFDPSGNGHKELFGWTSSRGWQTVYSPGINEQFIGVDGQNMYFSEPSSNPHQMCIRKIAGP
jgi:hypothetical protein